MWGTVMLTRTALLAGVFAFSSMAAMKPAATFYKDVLPVLQKNCQECHRAGEAAPMAFTSYQEVGPWAKAIKASIQSKKMPPWFADPSIGKFHNARVLAPGDLETLVRWADNGAPAGNPKDAPKPAAWVD